MTTQTVKAEVCVLSFQIFYLFKVKKNKRKIIARRSFSLQSKALLIFFTFILKVLI